jgi:general secretion pathway protein G
MQLYRPLSIPHSGDFALESSGQGHAERGPGERPTLTLPTTRSWRQTASWRQRRGKQRGFTVVELLIVCAVLMTIFAIAIPSAMAAMDAARVARAVGDVEAIEDGIALYEVINGQLPDDLSQVGYGGLKDPWGIPYQYLNHTTMNGNGQVRKDRFLVPLNDDYDLYSMGKDRASVSPITAKSSQDDILRASSGSYVGLASGF